jgi:hypothetical protein
VAAVVTAAASSAAAGCLQVKRRWQRQGWGRRCACSGWMLDAQPTAPKAAVAGSGWSSEVLRAQYMSWEVPSSRAVEIPRWYSLSNEYEYGGTKKFNVGNLHIPQRAPSSKSTKLSR